VAKANLTERVAMPVALAAIVSGFYWKLTLTRQFDWVSGPDLVNQVLPWFQVQAAAWHAHHFPLWDASSWGGQPLLGQAQPGAAYPLNWLLFLMPLSHGKISFYALQWYFVAIHWMAALFCYWLCRDLGQSRIAAVLGGCIYSFSAYAGTASWPQMINGVVWAPLVFLFELRVLEGRATLRNGILSGASLGAAWLSGHHQAPLFLTLAWGGVWLFHLVRAGPGWNTLIGPGALSLLLVLLTGALQILPAYEYGHLAARWVGAEMALTWNQTVPYAVHSLYALKPSSLFSIVFPAFSQTSDPYVGVAALTLALLAIALQWRRRWTPLFATLGLASLLFALGPNSVFHGLLYGLAPMVEKARVPSAAVFLFGLAVAVLAAAAVDALGAMPDSPWMRRAAHASWIFGAAGAAILFSVYAAHGLRVTFEDRVVIACFTALLVGALLYGWSRGGVTPRQGAVLALLLVVFELGNNSGYMLTDRENETNAQWMNRLEANADIARFLASRPGPFRIVSSDPAVPKAWASWNGFSTLVGDIPSVTANVLRRPFSDWQFAYLAGVRYRIGTKPEFADEKDIFTAASGLKVYENPQAFPRAWAVHRAQQVSSDAAVNDTIRNHLFDLRADAFTSGPAPALARCDAAGEKVSLAEFPNEARLDATLNCDALVVVSDTFYPGWEAEVDGRPAPILEVDGCFRAVAAPAGAHEIVMRYRPASAEAGGILTVAGALAAAIAGFFPLTYVRKAGTITGKNVS
jgi:hypothetical protein